MVSFSELNCPKPLSACGFAPDIAQARVGDVRYSGVTPTDDGEVAGGTVVAAGTMGTGRAVVGAEVVTGAGSQAEEARPGARGGGSLGFPAPAGWKRQPSTTPESTRDPAGPTFW